jgi:hypothetical protein
MSDLNQTKSDLKDYLRGMSRGQPESLQFIIANPIWQRAAHDELERRARKFLDSFTNQDLDYLAKGQINLVELAKDVKNEALSKNMA